MVPAPRHGHQEAVAAGRARDDWWTPLVVDPAAVRLVRLLANHTPTTPNQLTALSAVLTVAASGGLLEGSRLGLAAGAVLYQLSLLADRMDGRLARLTGTVTELGAWFGAGCGRARFLLCAPALLIGQYSRTDDRMFLFLAALVICCHAIAQIVDGHTERFPVDLVHGVVSVAPAPAGSGGARGPGRPRLFARPVTEVEFGLAVCVLAPMTGAYLPVIVLTAALLLVGELAVLGIGVRLFLRTRQGRSPASAPVARSEYGSNRSGYGSNGSGYGSNR